MTCALPYRQVRQLITRCLAERHSCVKSRLHFTVESIRNAYVCLDQQLPMHYGRMSMHESVHVGLGPEGEWERGSRYRSRGHLAVQCLLLAGSGGGCGAG